MKLFILISCLLAHRAFAAYTPYLSGYLGMAVSTVNLTSCGTVTVTVSGGTGPYNVTIGDYSIRGINNTRYFTQDGIVLSKSAGAVTSGGASGSVQLTIPYPPGSVLDFSAVDLTTGASATLNDYRPSGSGSVVGFIVGDQAPGDTCSASDQALLSGQNHFPVPTPPEIVALANSTV
ncbi:hypothetical protein T439DRAFT_359530 [Meredithblackwellia eburnea MCA 4105]